MSEYLSDQGKRTQLLDYLVSIQDGVAVLAEQLTLLNHGNIDEFGIDVLKYHACTQAMNLLADWQYVGPILADLYRENYSSNNAPLLS